MQAANRHVRETQEEKADQRSREWEVEKEAHLVKHHLQAANRHVRETQEEKESCSEKITFEAPIRSGVACLDQN